MAANSLTEIAPAETAVGHPTATARRAVNASVSDNTRRAYAGALGQLDAWLDGLRLDDAALAAYLAASSTTPAAPPVRVPTRFVPKYTLRVAHLELGWVDLALVGLEKAGFANQPGARDVGVGDRHGVVRNKRAF